MTKTKVQTTNVLTVQTLAVWPLAMSQSQPPTWVAHSHATEEGTKV